MTDPVECRRRGRAVELILSRPQAGNAFDGEMVQALHAALDRIEGDSCDTIVFRGAGKGFCSGLDLSDLERETDATFLWRLVQIELLLQRVASMPQETVALAHRFAFGAGADLFVACRRRIATPGTKFAFPGVRFGIALGTGRLARCVGPDAARRMLAATAPISLEAAQEAGLVQEIAEPEVFPDLVAALADTPTSLDPRMACIVAERLASGRDDEDLAALVRSAALPGLRQRIADYAAAVAAARGR